MDDKNIKKEKDKYDGMVGFGMELTPSLYVCGIAGVILGAVLAW